MSESSTKAPFHLLCKPIGPICNLRCEHCFYLEKRSLYPRGERYRMSDATLERFVPNRAVTTLCVVQGHEYDPTAWARARGAHDLTIGADVPTGTIIDAGTATSIERVRTERHWRGLTTRGDRARISAALADAGALEPIIEPLDLEVWALTTGWRPAAAERLRRLAETMSRPNEPRPTVGRHRAELAA